MLPVLALESNGLRVFLRLGVAKEAKSYTASYKAVRQALPDLASKGTEWIATAHRLLRLHGQETCRASSPECGLCPLREDCAYYADHSGHS